MELLKSLDKSCEKPFDNRDGSLIKENRCNIRFMDLSEALLDEEHDEKKRQFVLLRASGLSYSKISSQMNVSKPTLIKWGKILKRQIDELKMVELEDMYEEMRIGKKKRIEMLAKMLGSVNAELASRDLSVVPEGKLFDIIIKLMELVKSEFKDESE